MMPGPPLSIDEIVKDPRGLLDYALTLPESQGLTVTFGSYEKRRLFRFKLYSIRNAARRTSRGRGLLGPNDVGYDVSPWDGLSFLYMYGEEGWPLWIGIATPREIGIEGIAFPKGHEPENIKELQKDLEA